MNAIQHVPNETIAKREAILRAMGEAANQKAAASASGEVERRKAQNTITAHRGDLTLFSRYLGAVSRAEMPEGETLRTDPTAWLGVTWGIVAGFVRWMEQEGYAVSSMNRALSTVKTYTKIATQAGVLNPEELVMIAGVKGYGVKEGGRLDTLRATDGTATRRAQVESRPTHRGTKAAHNVPMTKEQMRALKNHPDTPQGRRDALLVALLLDHGLRESEAEGLQVENIDLAAHLFTFYRPKTGETTTQAMSPATLKAMRAWVESGDAPSTGALLRGSRKGGALTEQGMSTSAIRQRVRQLGEAIGIEGLSPHDLRHAWATAIAGMAAKGKVTVLQLQEMGGWSSLAMPRRYVEKQTVSNAGIDYSDL